MKFCDNCNLFTEEEVCPVCKGSLFNSIEDYIRWKEKDQMETRRWKSRRAPSRFKTPKEAMFIGHCGTGIANVGYPQGFIRVGDSYLPSYRPKKCIECSVTSYKIYNQCLTYAALRNWSGWALIEESKEDVCDGKSSETIQDNH